MFGQHAEVTGSATNLNWGGDMFFAMTRRDDLAFQRRRLVLRPVVLVYSASGLRRTRLPISSQNTVTIVETARDRMRVRRSTASRRRSS